MPAATRRRQAAITESYSVDKRICAHQAKFGGNAEIDLSPPRRSVRSTRSIRYTSYSDSDDDEQEEEQYDEEEYYEEQEEQYEEIESDVEETLRPLIKTTAVVSRIIESASGKIFKNMATEVRTHFISLGHMSAAELWQTRPASFFLSLQIGEVLNTMFSISR